MTKKPESDPAQPPLKPMTRLIVAGRDPSAQHGFVNPPVYHASTVLYPNAADMIAHRARYQYGRRGTPTSEALTDALQELEGPGCAGVSLMPSGLAAISTALLSVVSAGDHILVSDNVYRPTRNFCDKILTRFGVETTYYDPHAGASLRDQFRDNTRAIFIEVPGSQTFEMQDIPAIADMAHARDAMVLIDNTWATPLYFRAFEKGVDLSIQAATKYIGGHSDIMFGTVSASPKAWPKLADTVRTLGVWVGPDDIYLALRGLRTLGVRMARHYESGLAVARWLAQRPEVLRVLHPALEGDPGHAIWKRDFEGAASLFALVLEPVDERALAGFVNALQLFGIGSSWGGYESLVSVAHIERYRTATRWNPGGPTVRLHIGLEDPADLIADLAQAFGALRSGR